MNPTFITAIAGLAIGALAITFTPATALFLPDSVTAQADGDSGERWACPMLDFIGTHAGACPVCGMKMERMTAGEITREQRARMGVETATVTSGHALVTVRASGSAEYDHRSTAIVIPRISGRIVARHDATFGCCTVVAAGEPIIDLYSPEAFRAQAELQTAVKLGDKSLIENLRQRFVRWNLTPLADAVIKGEDPVDTVTITSPIGGQVWFENMEKVDEDLLVGREITADTMLLRLVKPNDLVLILHVPETRAAFLRENQPVLLSSDDRGDLPEVKAVIGRVAYEIDPEIRTVEVRIYISGARDVLRPGSLVTARMRGALSPNLQPVDPSVTEAMGTFALVPKTAVLSTGVRHVAWRLKPGDTKGPQQYEPVPLWLGPRIESDDGKDLYVVRSGLKAGDQVATQGAFLIDAQAQLAGTPSLLYPTGAGAPAAAHQH
ncbi:MAG: efflux RND transporter periplasmic adaptor subunit [Planctomycetes bacterium]|nr:efflux RND transporter periplasmic adaptor subunit [Planctomycetota bacterium]